MKFKKSFLVFFIWISFFSINAEENKIDYSDNEFNIYSGMFDFSDDGKKSTLIGLQHQNENLNRNTFIGNVSPITGGFVTENSAAYVYTGIEWTVEMNGLTFTPSFAPGLYSEGDGKDLGHVIEFKSEIQISINLTSNSEIGISYNHLSNASLGSKNPGANSYIINFIKKY